jgi:hypothetical protein
VNDIVGAQLPLLREIYAAPLAESRVEARGLASTSSAAGEAAAGEAAAGEAAAGEAAAAAGMHLPISLEARQELVRPLPPLPAPYASHRTGQPRPETQTRDAARSTLTPASRLQPCASGLQPCMPRLQPFAPCRCGRCRPPQGTSCSISCTTS